MNFLSLIMKNRLSDVFILAREYRQDIWYKYQKIKRSEGLKRTSFWSTYRWYRYLFGWWWWT